MTTGEGGMVVTGSDQLDARMRTLCLHGMSRQAADIVRQSGAWLGAGRVVALLAAALIVGTILLLVRHRRTVLLAYAVVTVPIVLLVIVLATLSRVSPERIAEVGRLAMIFIGALLLVLPFFPQLRSDRHPT